MFDDEMFVFNILEYYIRALYYEKYITEIYIKRK